MTGKGISRRGVLKLCTAASVAGLAGCGNSSSDSPDDIQGISDTVPSGPNLLMRADMETILGDGVVRDQFNATLTDFDSGLGQQPSISALLRSFQDAFGLDPSEMNDLVAYVDLEREESAAILEAEWSEDQIQAAIGTNSESYNGQSVYQSNWGTVGVLPDGRYVASTPAVVRKVIDVASGEKDSVTGDIVTGFSSASDGYLRFAFMPPADFSPGTQGPFDFSPYKEVDYGYGTLYTDGETLSSELVLEAASSNAATEIEELTNGILELGATQVSNDDSFPEDFGTVISATEISTSGTTIRVENDDDRGYALLVPLAVVSSFVLGLGSETSDPPPQISVTGEYSSQESTVTLTVTAISGDVEARNLIVRGNTPENGKRWYELPGAMVDQPGAPVLAGDSATVTDVTEGDTVELEYDDGSTSFDVWIQEF